MGTYTSPHLERFNERIAWNGEPMSDAAFVEVIEAVASVERTMDEPPTVFEILTAAAFRWFADIAVDVAVVEVGLGGRWDATNVADGQVAVVTNVSLDHAETIGPTLADIATEKAGIVKPGSILVLGETEPGLAEIFRAAGPAEVWERDRDFASEGNHSAHGGRLLDLRTPGAVYTDVYIPVYGAHQGDNAAVALAAAEAFFGAPSTARSWRRRWPRCASRGGSRSSDAIRSPCSTEPTTRPGRAPPARPSPRPSGRRAAPCWSSACSRAGPGRDVEALGARSARLLVACPAPSPRTLPPGEVAAAGRALGLETETARSVPEALARAFALAAPEDLVLVSGSLYVVGAARAALAPGR